MQKVKGAKIAAKNWSFGFAFVQNQIAFVFFDLAVLLIQVPLIVCPGGGWFNGEWLVVEQAFLEIFQIIFKFFFHAPSGEVGAGIGDQSGFGGDGVGQGGDVGISAENFRVVFDQSVVQVFQDLI